MKLGFFRFYGTNPTQAQWHQAIAEYEQHESRGLSPNEIGDQMGVTRGTACVLRRLSREARI